MLPKAQPRNTRQPAANASDPVELVEAPDDLRSGRRVRIWVLGALVLAVIVLMALQLVSWNINEEEPYVAYYS